MEEFSVIGDPHARPDNLHLMVELAELIESRGLPAIWLGDMLDTKEVVRSRCLNFWYDYFKSSKLSHIVIVGNHDWQNLECEDHSLRPLKELPNVTIVDRPISIGPMDFLPYYHDLSKLKAILKRLTGKILFLHQGINGYDFGNGHVEQRGLEGGDLPAGPNLIISGHFHKYQADGRLVYLGTPISHSFGESDQVKYIGRLDVQNQILHTEESPLPRHVTYEIEVFSKKVLQENWAEHEIAKSQNIVRVILRGPDQLLRAFPVQAFPDAKIIMRPTVEDGSDIQIEETLSNAQQFEKWAKDIKGLDDDTIQLGLELLREA